MTYQEFVAQGNPLILCGGPFDGRTVDPRGYEAWPSFITMIQVPEGRACRYRMRIGDLQHYDFDGSEEPRP